MNINLKRYIDNAIKREVRRSMLRVNRRKNDDLPVSPEAMESAYKYITICIDRLKAFKDDVFVGGSVPIVLYRCIGELLNAKFVIRVRLFGLEASGLKSKSKDIEESKNHLKMALRYLNSLKTLVPAQFQSDVRDLSSPIETAIIRLS